jgi:PIN domain nuclease of toxin-antitoxin system
MNILLDTHAFIWWDSHIDRLSPTALEVCQDSANTLFLSVVSVWEIQIKHQLGKLTLDVPLVEIVNSQQSTNGLQILPVELSHVLALDQFPLHHRDPFDRLLLAQAKIERAVLLSCDPAFEAYSAYVLW